MVEGTDKLRILCIAESTEDVGQGERQEPTLLHEMLEEMENLNRTLTVIAGVYEMQLKVPASGPVPIVD